MLSVNLVPLPQNADLVVVIDVLRFSTSAAYALAHGARSIIPCSTIEDARAHAPNALLAGERHAVKPDGFDLGNSPLEFSRDAVQGRDVAWTTTNGTRALSVAAEGGTSAVREGTDNSPLPVPPPISPRLVPAPVPSFHDSVLPAPVPPFHPAALPSPLAAFRDAVLASYVNLSAVVALLRPRLEEPTAVAIVCAGRDGGFALEDAACAGALVRRLQAAIDGRLPMNDGARACACLDEAYGEDLPRLFRDAQHGRFLRDHGFGADLDACAAIDAVAVVPRWRDGCFVAG